MSDVFQPENAIQLGWALLQEGMANSDPVLLRDGIWLWRQALNDIPDHPYRVQMLLTVGLALQTRFELTGELADVDEAIIVLREAGQVMQPTDPYRAAQLANLGVALRLRNERLDEPRDLEEAIAVGRAAVAAPSLDDADRARSLSLLGLALRTRFERAGELVDVDEAIRLGRNAVRIGADGPDLAQLLTNLTGSLQLRFEAVGARDDLDEAIEAGRGAVHAADPDDPERPGYLSNLGVCLRVRFELVGTRSDLNEAIDNGRQAVRIAKSVDPNLLGFRSNLAVALRARFEATGARDDVDEAIMILRRAVQDLPAEHPDRAMYLSNLGAILQLRSETDSDLDEAIRAGLEAVQVTPEGHSDRAMYLSNLGAAWRARFGRSKAQTDLKAAITAYTKAAKVESAAPSVRVRAAALAGSLAAQEDFGAAAELLEQAVRLVPSTASRRLGRVDQQYALRDFGGLASDAAAMVLLAGEADPAAGRPAMRALGLLELGRGVLLSQALDTRSDLTDLGKDHPELAEQFTRLRRLLDRRGGLEVSADTSTVARTRRTRGRQDLARAFDATMARIRKLAGFETFLLPPEPGQLLRHADRGPVVVINVSQYRSDALVLHPDAVTCIPLPDLAKDALTRHIDLFYQALRRVHAHAANEADRHDAEDTLSMVLEWLWDAAADPILQRLQLPQVPWPPVWWAPGGLLGLLPLHAAGYHREPPGPDGRRRTVLDRVISSYTPTVRALGYARAHPTASETGQRALVVAMPTTPGLGAPLDYVAEEAALVQQALPESTLLIEKSGATAAQLPTRNTVLEHLKVCAIAHFACHGSSHASDPSQSRLLLHDHDTHPFTVASLAPIQLHHARLAYLSACRTAFNPSDDLIDEAIHLTTAFQLAGYPQLVGTLWEINDALATDVADTFYHALATGNGTIDTARAAQALHIAVHTLRNQFPTKPSLWAAYLHAGA